MKILARREIRHGGIASEKRPSPKSKISNVHWMEERMESGGKANRANPREGKLINNEERTKSGLSMISPLDGIREDGENEKRLHLAAYRSFDFDMKEGILRCWHNAGYMLIHFWPNPSFLSCSFPQFVMHSLNRLFPQISRKSKK
jgi:hypothetical protein